MREVSQSATENLITTGLGHFLRQKIQTESCLAELGYDLIIRQFLCGKCPKSSLYYLPNHTHPRTIRVDFCDVICTTFGKCEWIY